MDPQGCDVVSGGGLPDARLWGKSAGLPAEYPVVCHLLDTAAVAVALWDAVLSPRVCRRLAGVLGVEVDEARRMVGFWAGLHDVGKIIPGFQAAVPEAFRRLAEEDGYGGAAEAGGYLSHETATHWGLVEFFEECGYPPVGRLVKKSASHQIAQLLGGHHGCFGQVLEARRLARPAAYQPGLGSGPGWREQRLAHARAVRRVTGARGVPVGVLPGWAAALVSGLVVVADWLASQAEVIVDRIPSSGWVAEGAALAEHYRVAAAAAPGWVRGAGLGRALFPEKAFVEQFPFPPNLLQADVAECLPQLVTGSGLLLVTAPTGDGKTECALHAASVLARVSGASGLYFALPTMATADAMFARVREFAGANVEGERALTLLHSMAWLSSQYEPRELADGSPVLADTEAGRWLRTGRRGMLAPLANGTVDQALAGVLPLRYNVLRLLGLSDKVLVVDEAHAYGPWMHSLLVRLLEWLGAFGAPVVLLSATLTGRAASSLVNAYRRGAGFPTASDVEPCYPGWLFVDAASGEVSEPRQVESSRARTLRVETRQVRWDVQDDTGQAPKAGGRRAALRELLAPVAEGGGCVLVCCTTVAEAQYTYRDLRAAMPELAARPGGLRLLHSRFPAHERARVTAECETAYGKPGKSPGDAPAGPVAAVRPGSVLVATQIVEQSLDLDFDLVVSDLAPLAQLLQRAGRGKRHERGVRPEWSGEAGAPRLVVLEPVGEDGAVGVPRSWGTVYDASLLRRTGLLLGEPGNRDVAVPGDVQRLVDAVYADDFGDGLEKAARLELERMDAERLASAAAEGQLADLTAVCAPSDVNGDLAVLSERGLGVTEELLTTRLGADSGRAVCVYAGAGGELTLDVEGQVPLPGSAAGRTVGREAVVLIMQHTVPLPGRWLAGRSTENEVPASWRKRPMLADLVLLPMRQDANGRWTCRLGERGIEISDEGISEN
ncbi:CRISPR-associated helicase Cas3' [Kitasatospora purpeofusca]|uniref:CRISPR-associated helicase Cas3' n=1 Tax=Kitasatospora purpeofusca TaxID=67352 RepID=UPI00225BC337|nr:CRISPR-associated helicase Cas3' [Kitasatospora purpeofusca]MCX4690706.1 CRISPR-associated helicase Cas3' [Kitasatospora purpeofusca]